MKANSNTAKFFVAAARSGWIATNAQTLSGAKTAASRLFSGDGRIEIGMQICNENDAPEVIEVAAKNDGVWSQDPTVK